jgi:hypothetical protein
MAPARAASARASRQPPDLSAHPPTPHEAHEPLQPRSTSALQRGHRIASAGSARPHFGHSGVGEGHAPEAGEPALVFTIAYAPPNRPITR